MYGVLAKITGEKMKNGEIVSNDFWFLVAIGLLLSFLVPTVRILWYWHFNG